MYNPPQKDPRPQYSNYVAYSTNIWSDSFKDAYDEGFLAAKEEKNEDNPYKPSGHERDTTFMDKLHYYWWRGFSDGFDELVNGVNTRQTE